MSNKPQNVVRHEHFFPTQEDDENDARRVDACQLADGRFVIWDVEEDTVQFGIQSWEDCTARAHAWAKGKLFWDE